MPSRQVTSLAITAGLVVGSLWLLAHTFGYKRDYSELSRSPFRYPPFLNHTEHWQQYVGHRGPQRRKHVAIASAFGFHFDVYMAFAQTLGDAMEEGTIDIFAAEFRFGFQEIVDELGLWKHRGIRTRQEDLIDALNENTGDGGIDLVVFGTCEVDLNFWHDSLKDAWDRRDPEHKFNIVCGVHNAADNNWQRHITYWARNNAIRLLPLGDHVGKTFKEKFAVLADSPDPAIYSAGYQYIPVDVHIPLLNIPNLPTKPSPRHLSKAVIQGTLNTERRDYNRFFTDLIASLHEDPAAWGYHALNGGRSFEPNHESSIPPFELLLVGLGSLDIPEELVHVVTVHGDITYKDFYELVANTDIIVPAFASFGYFQDQASSTVALATELAVPLLVTTRHRAAYGYIDDSRAVVTRPAAMPEVQALRALRTGDASAFLNSDPAGVGRTMGEMPEVRAGVEAMLHEGWVRGRAEWRDWRAGVWQRNREVAERVLRDEV